MTVAMGNAGPPSLLNVTIRRSFRMGRTFLGVSLVYTVIFGVVLGGAESSTFQSSYPVILPIFAVVGMLGGVMVFANDRLKGVYEYLIAYGFTVRRLFTNVIVASFVLGTVLLGVSLAFATSVYVATGHVLGIGFVQLLIVYTLPMSYASIAFAATAGMFWTSLSSPRAGINSPVGVIPIVGIAPPGLTVVAVGVVGSITGLPPIVIVGAAVALTVVVVLGLLSQVDRLLPLERLLSPV